MVNRSTPAYLFTDDLSEFNRAVEAGGATIVPVDQAHALVWNDPFDVAALQVDDDLVEAAEPVVAGGGRAAFVEGRRRELTQRVEEESLRPFDLASGPLLRATLVRLAARESALLLTLHHAVSDGWSMGIFWGELFALYDAFRQGLPSPLPELPLRYADFAGSKKSGSPRVLTLEDLPAKARTSP